METEFVTHQVFVGGEAVTVGGEPVVVTIEQAIAAIGEVERIPYSAQDAVKEFISTNFENLMEQKLGVEVPMDILTRFSDFYDYLELILKYLKLII